MLHRAPLRSPGGGARLIRWRSFGGVVHRAPLRPPKTGSARAHRDTSRGQLHEPRAARPATQNYEAETPSARAARRVHATRGQRASVEKYSRAAEGGAAF